VTPGVGDVVQGAGNPFDTDRVNVKVTSSAGTTSLHLKYYTSFNGNDLSARYADIFIGNNPASPDSFHYGIALGDQAGNGGVATLFGDGLSVFWGTGDCSNDAIEAADPVQLPEPVSLGLFGAGLAGLAVARRRKTARRVI